MLSRSFIPASEQKNLVAYTPMFHARLYKDTENYRQCHFQAVRPGDSNDATDTAMNPTTTKPWLDGNPAIDRPLFVQFCANDPDALLGAALKVAPYCDAVDLNLGCPQGIAKKGKYGAFLQEDQDLIFKLINTLHKNLPIPVTAKIRILDTRAATLAYARNVLAAGASILTVHGRLREQKGHLTGLADWETIRWLRGQLPPETVLFANGNILQHADLQRALDATGADGVMSAEGNLSDPAIFSRPPEAGTETREYWRGKDGKGGYRVDAVMRRYMDILHKYAAGQDPPSRRPLFVPGDDTAWMEEMDRAEAEQDEPERKKRRRDVTNGPKSAKSRALSPNYSAMQPHMFHLLRHFVSKHTDVRDLLARSRAGDLEAYERILSMVERKVAEGLIEYEARGAEMFAGDEVLGPEADAAEVVEEDGESSRGAVKRCKRPWWVVQPIIRPLPKEAMAKGAVSLSKKDKAKLKAAGNGETAREEGKEEEVKKNGEKEDQSVQEKVLETDDKLLAG
ncbi:dihydrouridine synthase-domain-containing protein [Colletotrichum acutatum]|uniref:tRNA-dihydrouridine(16/17) synthase [NAD(P)(+)] n=1 Tax=Glomerella acutata TaxID=27357 RepID=A0AAD8XIZ2_GLOAC|nr:dihydrouridine synthase-domain-containing protein [Colletotrichum acutatum]KAK1726913.1 dihydrouridine synthase-domain-containing protein [Colletotrichum acutatum]